MQPVASLLLLMLLAPHAAAMRPAPEPLPPLSWPPPGPPITGRSIEVVLTCHGDEPRCRITWTGEDERGEPFAGRARATLVAAPGPWLFGPMPAQGRHLAFGPAREARDYRALIGLTGADVALTLEAPARWRVGARCLPRVPAPGWTDGESELPPLEPPWQVEREHGRQLARLGPGHCEAVLIAFSPPAPGVRPGGPVVGLMMTDAEPRERLGLHLGYEVTLSALSHAALALEVPLAHGDGWRLVPSLRAGLPGTIMFFYIGYSIVVGFPVTLAPDPDIGLRVAIESSIVAVHLALVGDFDAGLGGRPRSELRVLVSVSL